MYGQSRACCIFCKNWYEICQMKLICNFSFRITVKFNSVITLNLHLILRYIHVKFWTLFASPLWSPWVMPQTRYCKSGYLRWWLSAHFLCSIITHGYYIHGFTRLKFWFFFYHTRAGVLVFYEVLSLSRN